jgi:translation initiation factor 3 subunit I
LYSNEYLQTLDAPQKSLILLGHERPITQIKYNREGDLLFSSAKDNHPCVWYSVNGERLGTYDGHQGVVWCIDVDWETKQLTSGAGDSTLRIWDVQTGTRTKCVYTEQV